jgi:hypothetical protein
MGETQNPLSRQEIIFERIKEFHLRRVSALAEDETPLEKRDGGIIVLHLIPESCIFSRRSLEGAALKEHGSRIRPLGNHGGSTRFNVDGFLNQSGHQEPRAYSQLFRNGRLESVMSDVGCRFNASTQNGPYVIRCGLIERAVFEVVDDFLKFCQATDFKPPLWLFSALINCTGFRMVTGMYHDLSDKAVDRSPAILPHLEITNLDGNVQDLLRPWCDALWQASGLERSLNYRQDGKWHAPR